MSTVKYDLTYVVVGPGHGKQAGKIKSIPLAENISSPLVEFRNGVPIIHTLEQKNKTGTEFLETLYAAEGRADLWQVFLKHREEIRSGNTVKPFPDEMLPNKVLEWRRQSGVGTANGPFDPEAYLREINGMGKKSEPKADAKSESKSK